MHIININNTLYMICYKLNRHSIYSFVRKEAFFHTLNDVLKRYDNEKEILNTLNLIILSKNSTKFSQYFETLNDFEKNVILKNQKMIENSLQSNSWRRGKKYFKLIIKHIQ